MTDEHGTEDLLLGDGHVVVDVGEDRRLDVPALGENRSGARHRVARRGALVDALGEVALDPVVRCRSETSGPTSVAGSRGSPTFMARPAVGDRASTTSS